MTHIPPPAEELRLIDAELWQLDARRAQLLARRTWLISALSSHRPTWQAPAPTGPKPTASARPEASAPSVQNALLVLGGVLLTVAAMVFTLVSWGHLGITGRAMVLGAVTLAALAAPLPLLKRGLRSTAESVAGLGLALTVLDAVALHGAVFPETPGAPYTAVATALLAGLWTAYGLLPGTGALRLPRPAALVAAQLPLLFWAIAVDAGAYGLTAALLVTAGFDTVVALRVTLRSVRVVAVIGAYGVGAWGVLAAGWLTWTAAGASAAARAAALLLLAGAVALAAAWQVARAVQTAAATAPEGGRVEPAERPTPADGQAVGLAVASGLLTVAALGGFARSLLPEVWTVPTHLAFGIALLAALRLDRLPHAVRGGLVRAAGTVQALALLWALPVVGVVVLGPLAWTARAWTGAPADARAGVTADMTWPPYAETVPLVLAAVAAVLALAVRDTAWRPRALATALGLTWAAALTLPAVLELPYTAALLIEGATTAGALTAAVLLRQRLLSLLLALVASASLAFLALASQTATLAVLCGLIALFTAASWRLAPFTAPTSLVYGTALAVATGAAADWSPAHTALLVLAVPAAAALLAWRLGDAPATVPVEVSGAVAGVLAVALAATDLPLLATILGLCGVITAGTAVRADRRPVGYAAAALFVLAVWVRLAAWDIAAPEAYTLPVTVPALLVGALRHRRDPQASSWTAYAPGLAATLVPSLFAAWGDPHWTRPLLLGLAALLVTLVGAHLRLQSPLLLGGGVLILDALHELAPYLVQVTDALPRWVPPALAGVLLLALGATYERRLRDARRMRNFLGSLH